MTYAGDGSRRGLRLIWGGCELSGLVVLGERGPIVKTPRKPGKTREFRLPFEGVPPSCNQTMPQLVIAHIAFSG